MFAGSAQGTQAAPDLGVLQNGLTARAEVVNGDTIPVIDLSTVAVYTTYTFRTRRQYEHWTRTKYNVKIVYPYAILAAAKLKEYDMELAKLSSEKEKKRYIRSCERDLRNEFEDDLKKLTITQGKILMKLIDRESGKTTYQVVRQLRGAFQAAMWQTVATIFGHNLKDEYDAAEEDLMIERAVRLVEAGQF